LTSGWFPRWDFHAPKHWFVPCGASTPNATSCTPQCIYAARFPRQFYVATLGEKLYFVKMTTDSSASSLNQPHPYREFVMLTNVFIMMTNIDSTWRV
jgi:hypothetical protein